MAELTDIDAHVRLPADLIARVGAYLDRTQEARTWPSPRPEPDQNNNPIPPFPAVDNPIMDFLFKQAVARIDLGMDPKIAMLSLTAHAWMEGHVEGYDRARSEG